MQNNIEAGKLRVKDDRIVCPACKRKTSQTVYPGTTARYLPVYCPHCKQTHIVDIDVGQRCIDSPRR